MVNEEPLPFDEVVRQAIARTRAGRGLDQAQLAKRMQGMGHSKWQRQTVGSIETGNRRVFAEELLALALALECSISELLSPDLNSPHQQLVSPWAGDVGGRLLFTGALPGADVVTMAGRGYNERWVAWEGDEPVWPDREIVAEVARLEREAASALLEVDRATRELASVQDVRGDTSQAAERAREAEARLQRIRSDIRELRRTPQQAVREQQAIRDAAMGMADVINEDPRLTAEQREMLNQVVNKMLDAATAERALEEADQIVEESRRAAEAEEKRGRKR